MTPRTSFLGRSCLMFVLCGFIAISLAVINDEDEIVYLRRVKKPEVKESEIVMLTRYHRACLNETRVDPLLINKLGSGKWDVENNSLKEWAFCVLNKIGLMSEQGVFRVDVAMKHIPECERGKAEIIINKCLSKKEKPPLETAWLYLKCLSSRDPKRNLSLGIFPRHSIKKYKWDKRSLHRKA